MKRWFFVVMAVVMALSAFGGVAFAGQSETGNGAPSGAHYNLNIIGVPHGKTADMKGNNGGRIFVGLDRSGAKVSSKIYLSQAPEGQSFKVLDANGTDSDGAKFQLPLPGECWATVNPTTGEVSTPATCTVRYTVWIRALGKPDGHADMYTCVEDPDILGGYMCSSPDYWVDVTRAKGKSTFTNVSAKLLFLSANVDTDPAIEHVQLFDPLFDTYYWQYDNYGLKLAQMRFYMGDYTITW